MTKLRTIAEKLNEDKLDIWLYEQFENYESKTGEVWNDPVLREEWENLINDPEFVGHLNEIKEQLLWAPVIRVCQRLRPTINKNNT